MEATTAMPSSPAVIRKRSLTATAVLTRFDTMKRRDSMLGAARRAAVSHKQELAASTQKDSDSGPAVEREDLLLAFERINAMSDDNIISLPELQAGADDPVIQSLLQGADLTIDELFTRADTDSNGEVSVLEFLKAARAIQADSSSRMAFDECETSGAAPDQVADPNATITRTELAQLLQEELAENRGDEDTENDVSEAAMWMVGQIFDSIVDQGGGDGLISRQQLEACLNDPETEKLYDGILGVVTRKEPVSVISDDAAWVHRLLRQATCDDHDANSSTPPLDRTVSKNMLIKATIDTRVHSVHTSRLRSGDQTMSKIALDDNEFGEQSFDVNLEDPSNTDSDGDLDEDELRAKVAQLKARLRVTEAGRDAADESIELLREKWAEATAAYAAELKELSIKSTKSCAAADELRAANAKLKKRAVAAEAQLSKHVTMISRLLKSHNSELRRTIAT